MNQLNKIAKPNKLSVGLVFPLEAYSGSIAKMENQESLAIRAEELGFKALWFRDVPFNDPSFGDAGQLYDPWVYMAHIMNHTREIALATGSIILPLRHPVHTAKSLLSLQKLSKGRIIMGIASGDRPIEYPAFNQDINIRGQLFRDSLNYMKELMKDFPTINSQHYGKTMGNIDLWPKTKNSTAILVTGHSGQDLNWIANNSDGWIYYPRGWSFLEQNISDWTEALKRNNQDWKPYFQSLYIDLLEDQNAEPSGIHLGFKSGSSYAIQHLKTLEKMGVNHVIVNLKYSSRPASEVIEELGEMVLPHFS